MVTWLGTDSQVVAAIVVTGMVGLAGNVADGFEAIHTSFVSNVVLVIAFGSLVWARPIAGRRGAIAYRGTVGS